MLPVVGYALQIRVQGFSEGQMQQNGLKGHIIVGFFLVIGYVTGDRVSLMLFVISMKGIIKMDSNILRFLTVAIMRNTLVFRLLLLAFALILFSGQFERILRITAVFIAP